MPPSIFFFPRADGHFEMSDGEHENGNNGDVSGDLERKIQAAGRIYQSIKAMRQQNEQQQKKRLLRRRMRSLEDQNSWRKSHITTRQPSLQSVFVVGKGTTAETQSTDGTAMDETGQTTTPHKSRSSDTSSVHSQELERQMSTERHDSGIDRSSLSEGNPSKYDQQDEEELLQLCEEQQDLLERLVLHHQEERQAWDRFRDKLLGVARKGTTTTNDEQRFVEGNRHDQPATFPSDDTARAKMAFELLHELEESKGQIQSLQKCLETKERLHRQQMHEQQTKTEIAHDALALAMQRLETLQELAVHLQSIVMEAQKDKVTNKMGSEAL